MSERNGGGGVLWFLAGLGIGAAVGILYAPQSGSETREILMAKAEEGRDFVRKRAKDARDQAEQWAEKGKGVYTAQKEQIRSAVEAGRQAYREKTATAAKGDGENV
jgi:gas vesicle protein